MNKFNFIILPLHQFWLIGGVHTGAHVLVRARHAPPASPCARPLSRHLCTSGDEASIKKTGCIVHGCFGCGPEPGVALPRTELRTPVHQDGAPNHRPPGRRGRDPRGLAQRQKLSRRKVTPHILRHSQYM
jgi:hypothetical protein